MSTSLQNFYKASITRNWSATTGDFNVSVAPTVSSGYLVVSPNNSTLREIIYYTATGTNSYGPFVTVSTIGGRGVGGTSAQVHSIGESIRMNLTAEHWQEMQDDINSIIAAGLPAGTDGQIMVNNAGTWEAGASPKMTLLKASSGSDTTSSATTVDSVTISGLTALDTIIVEIRACSIGNNSGACVLYSVTDSASIIALETINSSCMYQADYHLMQSPENVKYYTYLGNEKLHTVGAASKSASAPQYGTTIMTTDWTGSWTIGLRHGGVTSGGTFKWEWKVYKLAGQ